MSGKYSSIPLPQTHTRRPPPQAYVPGCSGVLPSSVVGGSSKRGADFFYSAKVIARGKLPGHQWELQAACQAGGPEACAPPTAVLGGRPAWPRVTTPLASPRASRGGGTRGDRVWSVPRPAPGARFSPQCEGAEVQGSYPHPSLKVLCLKAEGRFFFLEITKTLCHFARCLGANL